MVFLRVLYTSPWRLHGTYCLLSLWRAARGSKLMRLELIHGLFITLTEFRLSTTFIPMIIIMHIYNWYHSITTGIHLYIRTQIICTRHFFPLLYYLPLLLAFFCSLFAPFTPSYLLGTLLAVTGSVHLVLTLLVN